ncbi:MAG: sigma-54-dependent Fis family transcriptional regulator [Desulfarculus sp.]|nr:sigma-54-dependent Fis family transcriptional regulator [Desulfarculus sp.]
MTTGAHVLLVEDDKKLRDQLGQALSDRGHQVSATGDQPQALEALHERGFQLVITGLVLPGGSGLEVVSYVKEHWPHTPVIVLSGSGSLKTAVEAMRRGAFDFHEKPFNLDHLLHTVEMALEKAALHKAFDALRREQPYIYRLENILAPSPAMQQVLEQVGRVAPTDVTVLLTGETGTGKSLIAGAIHANSPRATHTLVTVNCAALTETLLESELFGHEKGAFTGAHKYRTGRFEQAHGGSLFLDEVGDMSPATQSKVLRAIEDKEVQRVGGSRTIRVDVRIIAATNVDLQRAVQEGRFRGDLFYRLSITPIYIPPLRQRPEDILPLAEMFLWRICQDSKRPPKPMSPAANQALSAHSWPGNIRELRNVIERAVLFANGPEITPQDLGLGGPAPRQASASPAQGPGLPAPGTLDLEALEHWAILTALERSDWVQSRAAGLLGISPRALSYKLDKLELVHPELGERRRRR